MEERHVALRTAPRLAIDQLGPARIQRLERRPQIVDDEAEMVDRRLAPVGKESRDRKSTRLNSSHSEISYAVFCLKKKKNTLRRLPRTLKNMRTQVLTHEIWTTHRYRSVSITHFAPRPPGLHVVICKHTLSLHSS